MSRRRVILLSTPGLRVGDVTKEGTPTLHGWANAGHIAELTPTFPCVTSPVQASMLTGCPPREHGVIANGFYHRDRDEVEFWVAPNSVVRGEFIWDALRRADPTLTSAVWHAQNIKGASVDFIVTPAPIHEPDGTMKLWCYSKPDGLYAEMLPELGHFPLQHYWGPLAGIQSTRWILGGARWLIARHAPAFHFIYLPHLDYAAQKFGPDSAPARQALVDLDAELAAFAAWVNSSRVGDDTVFLVAGEYAMTSVSGAVFPNRTLRQAGLVGMREKDGREHLDLRTSQAFTVVDHQLAHVYVKDSARVMQVADLFRGMQGIEQVCAGADLGAIGMDHARSGEIVLIARADHWFAYPWWLDDALAPPFARTVDIHRKPGYDPLEMFFDPATKGIPLNTDLIQGSHGAPASHARQRAALIASVPLRQPSARGALRDVDVKGEVLELMR
ncbi:MAG: alkaline phosphatase family protein [Phycisphaerales bacterium]|nr:alkaline phosphatase family protein [Phycisphaerales bacterium]